MKENLICKKLKDLISSGIVENDGDVGDLNNYFLNFGSTPLDIKECITTEEYLCDSISRLYKYSHNKPHLNVLLGCSGISLSHNYGGNNPMSIVLSDTMLLYGPSEISDVFCSTISIKSLNRNDPNFEFLDSLNRTYITLYSL